MKFQKREMLCKSHEISESCPAPRPARAISKTPGRGLGARPRPPPPLPGPTGARPLLADPSRPGVQPLLPSCTTTTPSIPHTVTLPISATEVRQPSHIASILSTAIQQLRSPPSSHPSTFSILASLHLASSTRAANASALEVFLRWAPPDVPGLAFLPHIEQYLLHLSDPPRAGSARTVLAALTLVSSTAHTLPPLPRVLWNAVVAISHLSPAPRRCWFQLPWLSAPLARFSASLSPIYGVALLSFIFLLRVSEAAALSADQITDDQLGFRPSKRHATTCWRAATPFVAQWLAHLRQPLAHQGPFTQTALSRGLHQLNPAAIPRTLTWHSLRRGGATALISLGVPPEQLAIWGRWASPQSARTYYDPTSRCPAFPTLLCLHNPDGTTATLPPAAL